MSYEPGRRSYDAPRGGAGAAAATAELLVLVLVHMHAECWRRRWCCHRRCCLSRKPPPPHLHDVPLRALEAVHTGRNQQGGGAHAARAAAKCDPVAPHAAHQAHGSHGHAVGVILELELVCEAVDVQRWVLRWSMEGAIN